MFVKSALALSTLAIATMFAASGMSLAATITNVDSETHVVTITIDGVRSEASVGPGAAVTLCEKGCFLLFPSGDILPLSGSEKVVIKDGAGKVDGN